jgi:hypothetical protein
MMQSSRMIRMQIGQNNPAHVIGCDPQVHELYPNFIFRANKKFVRSLSHERMPLRKVALLGRHRSFAGIYYNNAFWMLNDPGKDGNGLIPRCVGEGMEQAFC